MIKIAKLNPAETNLNIAYLPGDSVLVLCDTTDAGFNVTIPDASSALQVQFYINKTKDANAVTLTPQIAGQKIQNEDTQTLHMDGDSPHLISDGSNWYIV